VSILTDASNAFKVGNFDNATTYASETILSLNGAYQDATTLRYSAEISYRQRLNLILVFSSVSLVIIIALAILLWKNTKNRFIRKNVLPAKPIVEDET